MRLAEESTSEAGVAKAADDETKDLGRHRDALHRGECEKLEGNEHWLQAVQERVEKQKAEKVMPFELMQLSEAAE